MTQYAKLSRYTSEIQAIMIKVAYQMSVHPLIILTSKAFKLSFNLINFSIIQHTEQDKIKLFIYLKLRNRCFLPLKCI